MDRASGGAGRGWRQWSRPADRASFLELRAARVEVQGGSCRGGNLFFSPDFFNPGLSRYDRGRAAGKPCGLAKLLALAEFSRELHHDEDSNFLLSL